MSKPILTLKAVSKSYKSRRSSYPVAALQDIDLTIYPGDSLAIVGESGSGKTTLGRIVALGLAPDKGEVWFDGVLLCAHSKTLKHNLHQNVQMVFQDHDAAFNPFWRFEHALNVPLKATRADDRKARIAAVLQDVGLGSEILSRFPDEVSGGQRQRLNIARALLVQPDILVADEPTSALDASVQARVINLFSALKLKYQFTLVVITHSLATIPYMCRDIAVIYLGRVFETGPSDAVLNRPLHPYTSLLIDSTPGGRRVDVAQESTMRDMQVPRHGCAFCPRCPRAQLICISVRPLLTAVSGKAGRSVACHFPQIDDAALNALS